jgi:hypothetical protein
MNDPVARDLPEKLGAEPVPGTPEEMLKHNSAEYDGTPFPPWPPLVGERR